MVAKIENAPPGQAEGRSEQQLAMPFSNLTDLTTWKPTPEPTPAACAYCGALVDVYRLGVDRLGDDRWICSTDIGAVVALAVDIYPTDISYTSTFEAEVLM